MLNRLRQSFWAETSLITAAELDCTVVGEHESHDLRDSILRAHSYGHTPLLSHERYTSTPLTYVHIGNARVDLPWGLVQVEPAKFLAESVHATTWFSKRLSGLPADPVSAEGRLPYIAARGDVDIARKRQPKRRLRGTYLQLGHWAAHNYGHFVMDCLAGVFGLREGLRAGRLKLLSRPLMSWQRELLTRLGVPPALEVQDQVVAVEKLVFPLALTCCYMSNPSLLHRDMFTCLSARRDHSAPKRIYISRASRRTSRVMVNEANLLAALSERGFRQIDPGQLSVHEQARVFSNADLIVSPLGAGLTNIGFAPAGCVIVEIMPAALVETWSAHLSQVLGHRFIYVIAPVSHTVETLVAGQARGDLQLHYEAPIDQTLEAIDSVIEKGFRPLPVSQIVQPGLL
jgi:capsular polysaccharide biosynthesis protein